MTRNGTPVLDPRDAQQILQELLARWPAYLPDCEPVEGQAGYALLQILSRYLQSVTDRLNQAPDKNLLAFLDMLGIDLMPAQAARAPVVFTPLPNALDGVIPLGTRLGADVPDREEPVYFETEQNIALAAARLVEVKTLWPARDEFTDHTAAATGGRPFTLFERGQPTPHELYLAHDTLLALAGESTVEIEFELSTPGSEELKMVWAYWDGQIWRSFKEFELPAEQNPSTDGTYGLTRSGVITLHNECSQAKKTTVHGIEAYWIRGCLKEPLPPDPTRILPEVDRVRIRTRMQHGSQRLVVTDIVKYRRKVGPDVNRQFLTISLFYRDALSNPEDATVGLTHPDGRIESQIVSAPHGCTWHPDEIAGQYRLRVDQPELQLFEYSFDLRPYHSVLMVIDFECTTPDLAFADGLELDVNKIFYPFGRQPQPGAAFYFSNDALFAKQGAFVTIALRLLSTFDPNKQNGLTEPEVKWEYWDGHRWESLGIERNHPSRFIESGYISFVVPFDMKRVDINGQERLWIRAQLVYGEYGYAHTSDGGFTYIEYDPPATSDMRLGYSYSSPWERAEQCLTHNDFQREVHSEDARTSGRNFLPFHPVADVTPALYLGFDKPLPNDLVTLFLDIKENDFTTPTLVWEAWNGLTWREIPVSDETAGLQKPGMVTFIPPDVLPRAQATVLLASGMQIVTTNSLEAALFTAGDEVVVYLNNESELATVARIEQNTLLVTKPLARSYAGGSVSRAALPRFGRPLDWVRARLKQDGAPAKNVINAIYLNAAWAVQVQSVQNELLGSSTGQPRQAHFFTHSPVLPGEEIEVRELLGPRAEVEYPMLRDRLIEQGLNDEDIRTVTHSRTGNITEVWVRWQARPHLHFSGSADRHYQIERSQGRLVFGDDQHCRIPAAGSNNIRARRYQTGGGLQGNVGAGAITQILSAASSVLAVTNPLAANGGADGEALENVKRRGPERLRHRGRSLSAGDYEALACEASPGVAHARALPATASNGRPAPGWVTVIIVPQSREPQPQPSLELRRIVHRYLAQRAPATLNPDRITVIGPTYLPIGVQAAIAPLRRDEAGLVEDRVEAALRTFLHPLRGGPQERGWPFGRDVYLSDVAALLEGLAGVDYVARLDLLLNGVPSGPHVAVPGDRIVVAGPLEIEMIVGEG